MVKFTKEQTAIIKAPLENILISAAAGSGKTAVMTERIVQRVVAGEADVRQLLVLTFTKNAAANMRDKIEEKLSRAVELAAPDRLADLESQLYFLPQAAISTVHSFCSRLLVNFSDFLTAVDLPPEAEILLRPEDGGSGLQKPVDEGEGAADATPLLKNRPVQMDEQDYKAELIEVFVGLATDQLTRLEELEAACLEESGKKENDRQDSAEELAELRAFRDCLNLYFNGRLRTKADRQSGSLIGAAVSLYHKLRSLPDYPAYLKKLYDNLCAGRADFTGAPAGQHCLEALDFLFSRFLAFEPEITNLLTDPEAALLKKNWELRQAEFQELVSCLKDLAESYLSEGQLAKRLLIEELGPKLPPMPLISVRQNDSVEKKRLVYLLRAIVGELLFVVKGDCATGSFTKYYRYEYLAAPFQPRSAKAGLAREEDRLSYEEPYVRAFFNFVLKADRRFALSRYERGLVHFSDLEQLALLLLRKEPVRRYCKNQYREIYVDEFQDTNDIQMAILTAIAENNLFVVGDIKQSIYRFRYAKPDIFGDLYDAYKDGSRPGSVFELHQNFRSHGKILRGINRVFKELMVGDLTKIRYEAGHAFDVHMTATEEADPQPRLFLCSWPQSDELLQASWPDLQPRAVRYIPKVRQLLGEGYSWGDLCILVKTNQEIKEVAEALDFFKVPYRRREPQFRADRYEQQLLAALVCFLDNPLQDQALLTVMTSPLLVNPFSERDLFYVKRWSQVYRREESGPETKASGDISRAQGYGFWQHLWTLLTAEEKDLEVLADRVFEPVSEQSLSGVELTAGVNGSILDPAREEATAGPDLYSSEPSQLAADLYHKILSFKVFMDQSRRRLKTGFLSEGLRSILDEAAFVDRLLTLPDGRERVDRVRSFLLSVTAYEASSVKSIADLASVLADENGLPEWQQAEADNSGQLDAVNLMTIHGSKGLEFPVVILGDFNLLGQDKNDPFELSEQLGVGADCLYRYQGFALKEPTITRAIIKEEERRALFAESLRLLYVAMTRAEAELHMVTADLNEEKDEASPANNLLELARAEREKTAFGQLSAVPAVAHAVKEGPGEEGLSLVAESFFKDWQLLKGKRAAQLVQAALGAAGGGVWPPLLPGKGEAGDGRLLEEVGQLGRPGTTGLVNFKRTVAGGGGDWSVERYFFPDEKKSEAEAEIVGAVSAEEDGMACPDSFSALDQVAESGAKLEETEAGMAAESGRKQAGVDIELVRRMLAEVLRSEELNSAGKKMENLYRPEHFPLKLTVSEVKRRMQADLVNGLMGAEETAAADVPVLPLGEQSFGSAWRGVNLEVRSLADCLNPVVTKSALTGGPELGQLLHKVFQLMNWSQAVDDGRLLLNLQRMVADGQIEDFEYRALLPFKSAFLSFAASDLNARVQAAEKRTGFTVYRELPFTLSLSVGELLQLGPEGLGRNSETGTEEAGSQSTDSQAADRVMVQGMIDLWFMEDDGAVLVDYKSDYLTGDDEAVLETLKERYQGQLELYRRAIEAASRQPVKEGFIWSIRRNRTYRLF